jgi:opacity protein-like surface antigen
MRKLFIFLLVVSCMTTAFAQETDDGKPESGKAFRVSIGGGGSVMGNFSTWSVDKDQPGNLYRYNASHLGIGPYLFVDLKYLEISLGLPLSWVNADDTMSANPNFPAQTLGLRGSAYVKLPFTLSPMFTLFPLLGVDYDLFFRATKDDDRDAKFPISDSTQDAKAMDALNTLWFKAGIGLDTFFTDHLFLRTELEYGLRLPNKMEEYLKDTRQDVNWMLGHGGDFKVAVGYRF